MMEFRISVRNLVEFILRNGDIDNSRKAMSDHAMAEGGRIHRMLQKRMGGDYTPEVPLSFQSSTKEYHIILEGRADGVLVGKPVLIHEIKGTYRHLDKIKEADLVHLAQAKCYAYMYAAAHEQENMLVRLTYCNMDTEETKDFEYHYEADELEEWFLSILKKYERWTDFEYQWKQKRQESIHSMQFPFPYRKGQKQLAEYVYQTIVHKKKLFLEAPTGVGKTISTVFPTIKAIGEEKADRLFYLTAKTITRTVADDTIWLLRKKGLAFKSIILTAKEKICFMDEVDCNPKVCPYAKGHFDRINDAIMNLLTTQDSFSREAIENNASKYQVCPFEMSLDLSLFADAVICDYNYLFDPHVYLRRFFAEGNQSKNIFLIDEAHNLIDRGREMYSAALKKESFLELKKIVRVYDPHMEKLLEKCNREILQFKKECSDYLILDDISSFLRALERLYSCMEEYLENHDESPVRDDVLSFYFEVSHFLYIYEIMDSRYVTYALMQQNGEFIIRLYCIDPSKNLQECMEHGISSILFSATLLPIQYHKALLGGTADDYEVYAESDFDTKNRALLVANDVTSKYTRRGKEEYLRIASYIHEIVTAKRGNYMVFFPSYQFMYQVYNVYQDMYEAGDDTECVLQTESMKEEEREEFLQHFYGNQAKILQEVEIQFEIEVTDQRSLIGFCVLGGIFSEGIDLKKDSLIGVLIVGTGIPQVCREREIIRDYFNQQDGKGYDYAYLYPGMNKVLQAAGRVIRTKEDRGVIALLDERFLNISYKRLFPREWDEYKMTDKLTINKEIVDFWNKTESVN